MGEAESPKSTSARERILTFPSQIVVEFALEAWRTRYVARSSRSGVSKSHPEAPRFGAVERVPRRRPSPAEPVVRHAQPSRLWSVRRVRSGRRVGLVE